LKLCNDVDEPDPSIVGRRFLAREETSLPAMGHQDFAAIFEFREFLGLSSFAAISDNSMLLSLLDDGLPAKLFTLIVQSH